MNAEDFRCPHCSRLNIATTEVGLKRHVTRCAENPANAATQETLADRVRKRANEKLDEAERLVQSIDEQYEGIDSERAAVSVKHTDVAAMAADAVAAFKEYRLLVEMLGAP